MNQVYIHILAPVVAALLMNGFIFSQRWKISKGLPKNPYIPPGGIVGAIWMILFALLGYVHFQLYSQNGNQFSSACIVLILFFLYSLAYPILTSLSSDTSVFSTLNIGALLLAAIATAFVWQEDSALLPYMVPLMLWTGYVNIVT